MATLAVIWRTAGLQLATSADSVLEVLPPLSWRAVAAVPAWVRGLFLCRGRLAPLVDGARLLGAEPAPDRMANRVLVLRALAPRSAHDWPVGLWVESVLGLERIDFGAAGSHPGFATDRGRFLGPIAETPWGQVQLVQPADLFTPEQAELLSRRITEAAA
jgi:chemotaxis signal transduction protein